VGEDVHYMNSPRLMLLRSQSNHTCIQYYQSNVLVDAVLQPDQVLLSYEESQALSCHSCVHTVLINLTTAYEVVFLVFPLVPR
jgi:hypothetical protein